MAIGYRRFPCLIPQDQPLFLYKSSFDNTPKRFFLCVWPKTPGVDRAIFIIRKSGNGNELVYNLANHVVVENKDSGWCLIKLVQR